MKNVILKRILIAVGFIIILLVGYVLLAMVLMPKDLDDLGGKKYFAATSYRSEEKNKLDFVFCGNSDVYSGFSPIEYYKQTGTASYVCSAAKQSANAVEQDVRFLIKRHNLKLIIIDVDCLFAKNSVFNGTAAYRFAFLTAPFKYHSRWKELEWKDFYTAPNLKSDPLKGYMPQAKVKKYSLPKDFMTDENAAPKKIEKSIEKNVRKIANLCRKNDVELLLVCLPTPSSWNNAKSNAVTKLAKQLGVPFVDLNFQSDDYNLDYSKSFRDKGNHMNTYGATYTTGYFVKYLNEHYDLPDHRNEQRYDDWNTLIPVYDEYIKSLTLTK